MFNPFSHYLQNNQAPSEDETREIKTLRENPLKDISVIDVEIQQIEAILKSLKRKRAHIQESINDFNTILAPVRRLPMDVLGVIFHHCLSTHRNPVMSTSEAPMLLTQICRDWKSIALSIPRLWSRLYIPTLRNVRSHHPLTYILEGERRMEARTAEVQRWLRLSSACPLAITLMRDDSISSFHQPLLDVIIESSRRWQQLELGFLCVDFESEVLKRLLSLSTDDLCMLQELRIYSFSMADMQEDLWHKSGLLNALGLRSISIAHMPRKNEFHATSIPPNWKNLNHLFIHSPILLGFAHPVLSYCCNLVDCLLEIAAEWDDTNEMVPLVVRNMAFFSASNTMTLSPCILLHLTFLSLDGDLTGCNQLLGSIEAPSLQILDYQGFFPNESEAEESEFGGLLNLLQKINSLQTLRVDIDHHTERNVLDYYSLVPSVTHLVLGRSFKPSRGNRRIPRYGFEVPENVTFAALHKFRHQYLPHSTPTLLFPSLEIFEVYDVYGVTDIMLLEFIKARIDATKSNAGVSKLKKVVVEFSGERQTDIVPEALAYAQAAGIKLELDLKYYITGKELDETWSPSFGLSPNDVSWLEPYDYY